MANYQEIVTKAVKNKGKKNLLKKHSIIPHEKPNTVLGCWIINHEFKGHSSNNNIKINGSYDVNIWYSFDEDRKTTVDILNVAYDEYVNMTALNNDEIIIRSLRQPSVNDVKIVNNKIDLEVSQELGLEIIGDTKVKISVEENEDDYEVLDDLTENVMNEIDSEVIESTENS